MFADVGLLRRLLMKTITLGKPAGHAEHVDRLFRHRQCTHGPPRLTAAPLDAGWNAPAVHGFPETLASGEAKQRGRNQQPAKAVRVRVFVVQHKNTNDANNTNNIRPGPSNRQLLTALCMALCGSAVSVVQAEAFSAADKALWIDRHNYFRMTALPFAAGNMLRIKWSDDLATQAEADASACAAKTSAGVNAALVASSGSAVDAAFQNWVVAPAMTAFASLVAPKNAGEAVGTGVYNSYSQVVWSSTNQVGCARATCGAQVGVACRYAPAGNDGTSPWYVHGAAGSACPNGLVSKSGLCVTSADDASYKDIAPIAAGQHAYDVFKDFIPNMQKALKREAVTPTVTTPASTPASTDAAGATSAPGVTSAPGGTPAATPAATKAPAGDNATTPAAVTTAPPPAATSANSSSTTNPPSAPTRTPTSGSGDAAGGAAGAVTVVPAAGGATPAPSVTRIVDGKTYVRVPKTTAPSSGSTAGSAAASIPSAGSATTDGNATPVPVVTKIVDGKVLVRVPKTQPPSDSASAATPEPVVTKVVDGKVYARVKKTDSNDEVVGTVKPSSDSGTTFANQATTAPAPSSATSTESIGANNKSQAEAEAGSFSAAGIAGVVVIGCVGVAGIAVFMSYRKNQRRQRDIMQNGGIHVL